MLSHRKWHRLLPFNWSYGTQEIQWVKFGLSRSIVLRRNYVFRRKLRQRLSPSETSVIASGFIQVFVTQVFSRNYLICNGLAALLTYRQQLAEHLCESSWLKTKLRVIDSGAIRPARQTNIHEEKNIFQNERHDHDQLRSEGHHDCACTVTSMWQSESREC